MAQFGSKFQRYAYIIVFPVCSNGLGTRLVKYGYRVGTRALTYFFSLRLRLDRVGKRLVEKPAVRLSRFSLDSIKKYLISEQSIARIVCGRRHSALRAPSRVCKTSTPLSITRCARWRTANCGGVPALSGSERKVSTIISYTLCA